MGITQAILSAGVNAAVEGNWSSQLSARPRFDRAAHFQLCDERRELKLLWPQVTLLTVADADELHWPGSWHKLDHRGWLPQ